MRTSTRSGSPWQACAVLLVWIGLWVFLGVFDWTVRGLRGLSRETSAAPLPILGALLALIPYMWNAHPRRVLGFIPIGAFGLTILLGLPNIGAEPTPAYEILTGFMVGLMLFPLLNAYVSVCPRHWFYAALFIGGWGTLAPLSAWAIDAFFWRDEPGWVRTALLPGLIVASTLGMALSLWLLFRELLELALEILIWPMYRIKAHGPGLRYIPRRGPVLVIANHSAWFDPMWLAKVLPRRLIPMMTSVFYDLPIIHWLMVHAAHAIRVEAAGFRRNVPELKEAIAALDRGECLIVFPEGMMRRKEEQPLRQFGQGIWHILKERPDTPVVACWIEGGWGCYFSYWKGPPTKNKRMDFRRHVEIGVSMPEVMEPGLLSEHRALRTYLMKACLEARRHLGKEPYALAERIEEEV